MVIFQVSINVIFVHCAVIQNQFNFDCFHSICLMVCLVFVVFYVIVSLYSMSSM